MTARGILVLIVLIAFLVFTAVVVADHGYVGFFRELLSTPVGIQVGVDLVIALTCFVVWMRSDAQSRGLPFAPYAVATLFLGSIGALAYLVHRDLRLTQALRDVRPPNALR